MIDLSQLMNHWIHALIRELLRQETFVQSSALIKINSVLLRNSSLIDPVQSRLLLPLTAPPSSMIYQRTLDFNRENQLVLDRLVEKPCCL